MSTVQPVVPAAKSQAAPVAAPGPEKVDAATKAAQDDAILSTDIKHLLIYELAAKGYAPNPADVAVAASRLREMVADSGGTASGYVAAKEAKIKLHIDSVEAKRLADEQQARDAEEAAELAKAEGSQVAKAAKLELVPGAPVPAPVPAPAKPAVRAD